MSDELIDVLEDTKVEVIENPAQDLVQTQLLQDDEVSEKKAVVKAEPDANLTINQDEFKQLKLIVEALLMASEQPLTINSITDILTTHNEDHNTRVRDKVKFNKKYLNLAIDELATDFADRAIEVKYLGAGYRIQTKAEYATWVQSLWQEKPTKYSKATLETLAIIAYRQPITRGEIEHIRGVAVSSQIIRTLLDRDWIKVVGHRDLPGKPGIYATTHQFLTDLNLQKLEELPTLADIKEIKADLFSGLDPIKELENFNKSQEQDGSETELESE